MCARPFVSAEAVERKTQNSSHLNTSVAQKPVTPSRYKYIFLVKVPARASLYCYYYHFTVLTCYECAIVRIIFICICMRVESYDSEHMHVCECARRERGNYIQIIVIVVAARPKS